MTGDERGALIALAHAVEPADAAFGRIVGELGPIAALSRIRSLTGPNTEGPHTRLLASDADEAEDLASHVGARIVTRVDREWPGQLADLGELEPYALWVLGAADLRLVALRSLSIVGARACTAYGEEVARTWSSALCDDGWTVVSGGAFGVDAAAHRGALAAGGVTICVLAGGVDMPYPKAHDALIARMADEGLVISESPLGQSVRRQRFLSRNRVIAALTRATLVVEAAARSGSIATARSAGSMNRSVLAVPGPVTSAASVGCHRMIRDGAALLVDSPADVASLLDLAADDELQPYPRDPRDRLSDVEKRVLDAVPARGAFGMARIAAEAGLDVASVWAALGVLEAGGWVLQVSTGWKIRRPDS